eukprot:TRINITY_DN2767_c0_g1_i2.p1 TRINITY_DN2767_c0_g1~~TRINITY_DN2767_c0_g1_i2.p1  ORF type:complete len:129 (+),score=31.30 TRINITY_DN2767_c0_g1_i2:316-702(+)
MKGERLILPDGTIDYNVLFKIKHGLVYHYHRAILECKPDLKRLAKKVIKMKADKLMYLKEERADLFDPESWKALGKDMPWIFYEHFGELVEKINAHHCKEPDCNTQCDAPQWPHIPPKVCDSVIRKKL